MIQEKIIQLDAVKDIKFSMLICSNHWIWKEEDLETPIETPSMHLISYADFLFRKSIFTTTQFKNPLVIYHNSGHSVPRLGN